MDSDTCAAVLVTRPGADGDDSRYDLAHSLGIAVSLLVSG